MKQILMAFLALSLVVACQKADDIMTTPVSSKAEVNLGTHKLATFSISKNSKYLVVFETGLGTDDHSVWDTTHVASQIGVVSDVLLYDRGGYGKSGTGPGPRDINKLRTELERVIDSQSHGRKVLLVGHSFGGAIIRDYAIKNPGKTAALLFVDPSHEQYIKLSQAEEDGLYNSLSSAFGKDFGGTMEARELIEDLHYLATLPNLPNVPTTVITSVKVDSLSSAADKQAWFVAHESLRAGVTDFTHVATNSGHYVMLDEPNLVVDNLKALLAKLP